MTAKDLLDALGVPAAAYAAGDIAARSPIDGATIGQVPDAGPQAMAAAVERAHAAFTSWRNVPAPRRGELVRLFGEELRAHKSRLAALVTLEAGKISSEGEGEVQEMIDICDFAVGLSRQLLRPDDRQRAPGPSHDGTVAPAGRGGRDQRLQLPGCGVGLECRAGAGVRQRRGVEAQREDPAHRPGHAGAVRARADFRPLRPRCAGASVPGGQRSGAATGQALVDRPAVALLSATGSTRMGRAVAPRVAARFGRCLLELGGNNAIIVAPTADLDLAVRGIVFGAYGTAGQRCTTTRRVIAHASIHDELVARLERARASLKIGDPRTPGVLVGPLVDQAAFDAMQQALAAGACQGGTVAGGERVLGRGPASLVCRAGAGADAGADPRSSATRPSRPSSTLLRYATLDEAIALQNACRRACRRPSSPTTCARPSLPGRARLRLRHRQRQHRHLGRRDRRRLRWREGDRRRPRVGLGRLEGLHAPRHQHGELLARAAAGAGRQVRVRRLSDGPQHRLAAALRA
jgi:aldehyde dehydrogenase (NAD+)